MPKRFQFLHPVVDVLLSRTQAALDSGQRLFDGLPLYDADRIAAIMERLSECTPFPWIVGKDKEASQNWAIAFVGYGDEPDGEVGHDYYVTTDHLHASEKVRGGASEDAELMAHAPADLQYLVVLAQAQRRRIWELENR